MKNKWLTHIFMMLFLCVSNLSAQDYSDYLERAKQRLREGNCAKAQENYDLWKGFTKKTDYSIERSIAECEKKRRYNRTISTKDTTSVNTTKTDTIQVGTRPPGITEPQLKRFHFGIVGGLSIANQLSNSWMYQGAQNSQFGFVGGLLFEHKINRYLSFQPELRFIMKGAYGKGYTSDLYYIEINGHRDYLSNVLVENTLNLNYLELPLNLVLNIPVSKTTDLFIGAGFYLAYGVSGKLKLSPSKEGYSFEEEESEDVFSGESEILNLNRFDRGINCMLGVRSYFDREKNGGSFFIRAGYERSLENMSVRIGRNAETFKNNCFYISMGVFL